MSILIVGEKPSVSRAISSVVGADKVQKGYTEGNGYIVSWCVGHLVGLKSVSYTHLTLPTKLEV